MNRLLVVLLMFLLGLNGCGGGGGSKKSALEDSPVSDDNIEKFSDSPTIDVEYTNYQYFALKEDGSIWTWGLDIFTYGDDFSEELLNNPNVFPKKLEIFDEVEAFSAGGSHLLALHDDGTVSGIGANFYGQLGDGSNIDSSFPVQVAGLSNVIAIATGDEFSMALKEDGTVWVWGENDNGQLGSLNHENSSSPIQVPILNNVINIAASHDTAFAVLGNGDVWRWGYDIFSHDYVEPEKISELSNIAVVTADTDSDNGEEHYAAISNQGEVWCWGANNYGKLGVEPDPTDPYYMSPIKIPNLREVVAVAVSNDNTYAVTDDGQVWGWGSNFWAQLGEPNSSLIQTFVPVNISIKGEAFAIEATGGNIFVVQSDGSLYGIGSNPLNDFADAGIYYRETLESVSNLPEITEIVGGEDAYFALGADGLVYSWGENNRNGILGNGSHLASSIPSPLPDLENILRISVSGTVGLALKADGTVWGWGYGGFGQLGLGSEAVEKSFTPIQIPDLMNIVDISAGVVSCLALDDNGNVWGWGINRLGNLGLGMDSTRTTPILIEGFENVSSILSDNDSSLVLKEDGSVWGLGRNEDGQLCNGTTVSTSMPVQVLGVTNAIKIATSGAKTFILLADGSVKGCGDNSDGGLGNGTLDSSSLPIDIPSLENIVNIGTQGGNSYAVQSNGVFWYWKEGEYDDVGTMPEIFENFSGMSNAIYGDRSTASLDTSGQVWTTGFNDFGQLGNGKLILSTTPVLIDENLME